MIQIRTDNNLNLKVNGIIINPISCTIDPKLNGENELEMECYLDKDGLYKYIQNNNYIEVPTPDFEEPQLYKIYNTKKSMSGASITAYARHIQFNLAKNTIFNKSINISNGQQALNSILENTGFTGHSNIAIQDIRQYKLRSVMNVLNGSEEDSFINVWGGEISCNNYDLTINEKRGADKGIRVTFGYNLEDIEEEINFDDVVTRLYPYSGDLVLSSNTPYVDSPLIANIGVLEDTIEFNDIKVKENAEDEEGYTTRAEAENEMIRRCKRLYNKGLDKITANYVVKMQDLSKTTEYKKLGYDVLEKVCLGDTVHCFNKNIDIEVEARCISYKWDCVNEEYLEIEIGQFISNYVNMQNNKIDSLYKNIQQTEQNILLKVDSLDNTLSSEIKITAEGINENIKNTKEGLELNISKTAEGINTTITNFKTDAYSEINTLAGTIATKTSEGEMWSSIEENPQRITQTIYDGTEHKCEFTSDGLEVYNGAFTVRDGNGNIVFRFNTSGTAGITDLQIVDTDKGSGFYNTLMNMEEISCGEVKPSRLTLKHTGFYIDNGYDLKDYIEKILSLWNLI